MAYLYISPKGDEVFRHSYSSGSTWDRCARLYQFEKVKGIRRKDKSAAMAFGKAVEDGVQFYHSNGLKPESGQDEFRRIWLKHKDNTEFVFTSKERDWTNLRDCGVQLLRLYEILLPTLPIKDPVWQISYSKEVFPGTTLAGIEMGGFVDLVSKSDWNHPLLPKIERVPGSVFRPLIIDLKTSGAELNIPRDMLALDQQLQTYSWLSGIPDVSFLWFTKGIADTFQKGTEVTLLEDCGRWAAGDKAAIFDVDEEAETALISNEITLHSIKESLGAIKGKGSTEAKAAKLTEYTSEGILSSVPLRYLTKMKIQFLATRIKPEDILEAGQIIAKQIVEIHDANVTGFYPKSSGVRFPNNHCTYCSHRGICLGDNQLRDSLLVQISTPSQEPDWMDDIPEEE